MWYCLIVYVTKHIILSLCLALKKNWGNKIKNDFFFIFGFIIKEKKLKLVRNLYILKLKLFNFYIKKIGEMNLIEYIKIIY